MSLAQAGRGEGRRPRAWPHHAVHLAVTLGADDGGTAGQTPPARAGDRQGSPRRGPLLSCPPGSPQHPQVRSASRALPPRQLIPRKRLQDSQGRVGGGFLSSISGLPQPGRGPARRQDERRLTASPHIPQHVSQCESQHGSQRIVGQGTRAGDPEAETRAVGPGKQHAGSQNPGLPRAHPPPPGVWPLRAPPRAPCTGP